MSITFSPPPRTTEQRGASALKMKLPSNNSGGIHVSSPSRSAAGIDVNALLPSSLLNESNVHKRLRKAAGSKDPAALPALLRDARISIPPLLLPIVPADLLDDTAHDGRSALHMACWTGCISNVVLLLDMGCDMNIIATRSHNYGKSPIFFAATRGREDVMTLLLDRGANVLIVNNKGQSVYSIAASHFDGSCELVGRIRESGDVADESDHVVDYSKNPHRLIRLRRSRFALPRSRSDGRRRPARVSLEEEE
ncbi:ankyrin repeat domain-containing protein [bacterium]|nr:ankyrin repeat domain-containing protein [bacterium]